MLRSLEKKITTAEVAPDVARWFVHDAVKRCERLGRGLPTGFLRSSLEFGPCPNKTHPGLEVVAKRNMKPEDFLALFEYPEIKVWLPDSETLNRLFLRQQVILTSNLVVDEKQRQEQLQHAIVQGVEQYFTPSVALNHARFCSTRPICCWPQGWLSRRPHVRAAADLFELPLVQVLAHPLARHFLERTLPSAHNQEPATPDLVEDKNSGLILPP